MLPLVAYLELARAAVVQTLELAPPQALGVRLEQVVFAQPVVVGEAPVEVHIALQPHEGEAIGFEVYTQASDEDEARVHAKGQARVLAPVEAPVEDLEGLRALCPQVFSAEDCYEGLARMGLVYGPTFRALAEVRVGRDTAGRPLAMGALNLPAQASDPLGAFALPPSLLGGALQASMGLFLSRSQDGPSLPFAGETVDAVEVFGPVPVQAIALVRQNAGGSAGDAVLKLDVSLADVQGRVCVRLQVTATRVTGALSSRRRGQRRCTPGAWSRLPS
ncbi:polyketide synthase dehydratase domain-containing protein [Variovorax sp. NFACC26]|uniref:polyketide synthase dehydratase domain-containing protein n=1 Tax=Variovorax sp. NFACC26 TaxID=1566275 RepID=UPI003AAFF9BA